MRSHRFLGHAVEKGVRQGAVLRRRPYRVLTRQAVSSETERVGRSQSLSSAMDRSPVAPRSLGDETGVAALGSDGFDHPSASGRGRVVDDHFCSMTAELLGGRFADPGGGSGCQGAQTLEVRCPLISHPFVCGTDSSAGKPLHEVVVNVPWRTRPGFGVRTRRGLTSRYTRDGPRANEPVVGRSRLGMRSPSAGEGLLSKPRNRPSRSPPMSRWGDGGEHSALGSDRLGPSSWRSGPGKTHPSGV